MRANAISRHRTQADLLRMSAQVKGSPFDEFDDARHSEPSWISLTRKRSLWACRGQSWHTGATSPTWQVRSARVQSDNSVPQWGRLGLGSPHSPAPGSTTLTIRLVAGATKSIAKPSATSHVKTATVLQNHRGRPRPFLARDSGTTLSQRTRQLPEDRAVASAGPRVTGAPPGEGGDAVGWFR